MSRLAVRAITRMLFAFALVVSASSAHATRRTWMAEAAMRTAFIGQTLDGYYGSGATWTEVYLTDGRLDYKETGRAAKGRWHFRGDIVFCTFYDPPFTPDFVGGCWQVLQLGANCYEFYTAGVQLPGRTQDDDDAATGLDHRLRWNARGWRTSEPSTCPERPSV